MPSSVLPDVFVKTWNLWNEGKQEEAQDYLKEFSELLKILSQGLGLSSWINKYVLYKRGVIKQESSYARIPGLHPTSMHLKEIDRILETTQLV